MTLNINSKSALEIVNALISHYTSVYATLSNAGDVDTAKSTCDSILVELYAEQKRLEAKRIAGLKNTGFRN